MVWDKLTQEEKQWVTEYNFTEETVNSHDVEDTINFLHGQYAAHGRILAESHEMQKRLRSN